MLIGLQEECIERKGDKMKKEIRFYNNEENRQVILDENTNEAIDDIDWLDLIGAKITRIREEPLPEPHLVFTLFKMPK